MKNFLTIAIAISALGGAVAWHYATKPPLAHTLLALDPSGSVERKCQELGHGVMPWLSAKRGVQEGSTISMLVMGRDAINDQATQTFDRPVPLPSDIVIGSNPQDYQAAVAALATDVERTCEAAPAGRNSPIYQMVRQSIEVLRAKGCKAGGRCYLLLKTDLDDDAHPLLRGMRSKSPLPTELAGSLDNAGIEIEICGTSELAPRKGYPGIPMETRIKLWEQMVTHPELVTSRPFCGAGTNH